MVWVLGGDKWYRYGVGISGIGMGWDEWYGDWVGVRSMEMGWGLGCWDGVGIMFIPGSLFSTGMFPLPQLTAGLLVTVYDIPHLRLLSITVERCMSNIGNSLNIFFTTTYVAWGTHEI